MDSIYLDYAATSPVSEETFEAMKPYFCEQFGNANSPYALGRNSAFALDSARRTIAACIGAKPEEIFFTSGGSESNNWALKGIALTGLKRRVLISSIEHPSLINAAKWLELYGYHVTKLPVDADGILSLSALEDELDDDVALVSVMTVNNEVGSIQPIAKIAALCRTKGVTFHTDAVQAVGYANIDVRESGADMLTLSAHKFGGPKGVGILYVRKGIVIDKWIHGGHQERSMRGGTSNTPLVVGMATALSSALAHRTVNEANVKKARDAFVSVLKESGEELTFNGEGQQSAQTVSLTVCGVDATALVNNLDARGVYASAGSACSSGSIEPSYVLTAMGLTPSQAASTVRFTFGKEISVLQAKTAAGIVLDCIRSLRSISLVSDLTEIQDV